MYSAVPLRYWRNGALFELNGELAKVEACSLLNRLSVSARVEQDQSPYFFFLIVDMVKQLLANWCTGSRVRVLVPCSPCIRKSVPEPYLFEYEALAAAVVNEIMYLECESSLSANKMLRVAVSQLAPDLAMHQLSKYRINADSVLVYPKVVAQGGYANLFVGLYAEALVAVKILRQEEVVHLNERLELLEEFRREVSLMASLQHQNLVNLRGFCLGGTDSIVAMVMEYMDRGDLYNFIHQADSVRTNAANNNTNNTDGNNKNPRVSGQVTPTPLRASKPSIFGTAQPSEPPPPPPYSMLLALKLIYDIADGMCFLHNLTPPVIHRYVECSVSQLTEPTSTTHIPHVILAT